MEEFYYNSNDGKTKIRALRWVPETEVKAVLQISHGMLEHMERYDEFASYMADNGVLVVGNDHLGHGSSVNNEEDRGFFSDSDGYNMLIEDMHSLMINTKVKYPDIPYCLLGHSMGSFLTRYFITVYGDEIDGAIIMGTGHQAKGLINFGLFLTKFMAKIKGWNYRSKYVNHLVLGANNDKFKPSRTKCDWLTRDEKIVDEYLADKRITFIFTLNGFYNLFKIMIEMNEKEKLSNIPKEIPVLFISGKNDPVGGFGKGVNKSYDMFKALEMKNVSIKLFEEDRHEILNELDREQVYEDILRWIELIQNNNVQQIIYHFE
ncbi:alpha/beta hydrolase [Sedimentibacter sp.]|uniref:alpha/beta hydrolase n=1 Tax=Sedimentibacter sp. TaxID=1960295 RepID=UPI0028AFE52C|nr:alpha/beta hydrolase [Sedimentibacter sp.]